MKSKKDNGNLDLKDKSDKPEKRKDVFSRLMKNDNDLTEKSTIKVDEN